MGSLRDIFKNILKQWLVKAKVVGKREEVLKVSQNMMKHNPPNPAWFWFSYIGNNRRLQDKKRY